MAGYGMLPVQPPLPTAWNFPFQPDAGSHTSILMSESADGVSVAAMRQNAGSFANTAAGPAGPDGPGGANAPAAICCAVVTFAWGRPSAAIDSHVAEADAAAGQNAPTRTNAARYPRRVIKPPKRGG